MRRAVIAVVVLAAALGIVISQRNKAPDGSEGGNRGAAPITLRGASQFDENHAFTRTLKKFEQLVQQYYDGPVAFELYLNSELGLEKDYFGYMSQGISVDYAIVSPSHMSTFAPSAPLMDMPFLFRDLEHWNSVLDSDALDPIAAEVAAKADVILIGYAGGGIRNLITNRPVTNMQELQGLTMRVMGAPIQTRMFQAMDASPTVIAYSEVYNAIQTGVIDGAENEAAGLQQMRFYEVGPHVSLTQHAITVRPFAFSGKTFRGLPTALQEAIVRAGREAGAFGRHIESTEDAAILDQLVAEGKTRVHEFTNRDELLRRATPVKAAYAQEIMAHRVLDRINAVE